MKKYIKNILLSALVVLPLSCSKEQPGSAISSGNREQGEEMTLSASFENTEVKTYFGTEAAGKMPVCWEADDMLWVSSNTMLDNWAKGAAFTTNAEAISKDGKSAVFKGVYRKDGKGMVAVYPYESVFENASYSNLVIDIPSAQAYNPSNCAKRSCTAVSYWADGDRIVFSYIAGCLKLSLKGSGQQIGKMVVMDNNASHLLWGKCTVTPNAAGDAIGSVSYRSGSNALTVECQSAVTLGSTASDFFVMVPGGSFSAGMTIALYDRAGTLVKAFKTDKDNTVGAGKFIKMPEADIASFADVDPKDFPVSSTSFSGGSGTADDPFVIAVPGDIAELSQIINSDSSDPKFNGASVYYSQTDDIDMAATEFEPIGTEKGVCEFKANYDGGGHIISKASPVRHSGSDYGIFGCINGGSVKNLTISDFNSKAASSDTRTGALAGTCIAAEIKDCTLSGSMVIRSKTSGGLVGALYGCEVSGCVQNADITSDGATATEAGGLFGYVDEYDGNYTVISNCVLKNSVSITTGQNFIGGLVGYLFKGHLSASSVEATGVVSATGNAIGGLVGRLSGTAGTTPSSIRDCKFYGKVSGVSGIGGIVGGLYGGQVINCTSYKGATITGTDYSEGGIAGRVYEKANCGEVLFDNCISNSLVTGPSCIGAITGSYKGATGTWLHIRNCAGQSSGMLTVNGIYNSQFGMAGAMVGWMYTASGAGNHIIENCYSWSTFTMTSQPPRSCIGGYIGLVNGNGGTITIRGCYSWLSSNRITRVTSDDKVKSFVGDATDANAVSVTLDRCYALNSEYTAGSVYGFAPETSFFTLKDCETFSKLTDGRTLEKLKAFVDASGDSSLLPWTVNSNGYPMH